MLIRGIGKWVKVLGEPVWGYQNAHKEWSLDLYLDEETVHRLEVEGLKDKIKFNKATNDPFMTFKRREFKQDGTNNSPIRVVDHHGEAWNPNTRIGNGSILNVNFAVNEYGKDKKSANILSMQVWELVKYEGAEFPVKEDADWKEDAE
jgi:hypothetical protein